MNLNDLLRAAGMNHVHRQIEVRGLTSDSRQVMPGYLFAAFPGAKSDGRDFIEDALKRGATALLLPAGPVTTSLSEAAEIIADPQPRKRFALMAAAFHQRQPGTVAAVTGTNGKTSVAHFARQIWTALGRSAGYLGTLGAFSCAYRRDGSLTTPDPVLLHQILRDMADGGVTHLAMEASSHGLEQFRADGVRVSIAAFTNLSRDHLDYHGTMAAYLAAKMRLFSEVMAPGGTAVLNADVPEFAELDAASRARGHHVIAYGQAGDSIRLLAVRPEISAQKLTVAVFGTTYEIVLPLAGRFQAANALCALGCVVASGAEPSAAVAALERLEGVPGRLQKAGTHPSGAAVYVDYAHTPDALETVLSALRPHVSGRLHIVFGCGGDRDRGKRPLMGERAQALADVVIVTDDNPRTEVAASIRAEVLKGCPGATEIGDRDEAIRTAISNLKAGDILLLAGKGHEQGQIVGDRVIPFSDVEAARRHLVAAGGKP